MDHGPVFDLIANDKAQLIIAGVVGGLTRAFTLREDPKSAATSIFIGGACALYLGPFMYPMFRPILGGVTNADNIAGFSGFVAGLSGTTQAGLFIDFVVARRARISKDASNGDDTHSGR